MDGWARVVLARSMEQSCADTPALWQKVLQALRKVCLLCIYSLQADPRMVPRSWLPIMGL